MGVTPRSLLSRCACVSASAHQVPRREMVLCESLLSLPSRLSVLVRLGSGVVFLCEQ